MIAPSRPQIRARPRTLPRLPALVAFASLVAAACGGSDDPLRDTAERTLAAVCALDGSQTIDVVRRDFADSAHQGLHDLAGALVETDPAIAGDLLEAKQVIEEDLLGEPSAKLLALHLVALQEATVAAVRALGYPAEDCVATNPQGPARSGSPPWTGQSPSPAG